MSAGVVIVGARLAGQRCCEALRARGWEGPIRLVSDEDHALYDRPLLSKGMLAGTTEACEVALRLPGWHAEHGVELVLGVRAPAPPPAAFGSDQHGVRLQFAGTAAGHDRVEVEGDPSPATRAPSFTAGPAHRRAARQAPPQPACPGPTPAGDHPRTRTERSMTLLPTVDPLACSAHGDCAVLAPEIFCVDDTAVVIGTGPSDLVMAAAEGCPAVAISVVDEATGRQLYP